MRLVTYEQNNARFAPETTSVGVVLGDVVADLDAILGRVRSEVIPGRPDRFRSVEDVLQTGALDQISADVQRFREVYDATSDPNRYTGTCHPLDTIQLLPPVLRPSKVIGVGMNYRSFVTQIGEPAPKHPTLFHKTSSALRGHRQAIVIPPITDQAVPEGELAVIIGRQAKGVTVAEADAHIAGYACANDISARNLEFQTTQWTSGKMLETFCPLGPALVTPDEVGDVRDLNLRTILNGEVIQQGNTSDQIFSVQELVSLLSMLVPLQVGDVILTGTPSDLGDQEPPVYLTADDRIRVEIDHIGYLENPVTAAHLSPRGRLASPAPVATRS